MHNHSTSCHGLKAICGELDARLHKRLPGEATNMEESMNGNPNAPLRLGSNRDLLMETCVPLDLVIGNTLHLGNVVIGQDSRASWQSSPRFQTMVGAGAPTS